MRLPLRSALFLLVLALPFAASWAADEEDYAETIKVFQNAGESGSFFANSYGYAVFPTIGNSYGYWRRLWQRTGLYRWQVRR